MTQTTLRLSFRFSLMLLALPLHAVPPTRVILDDATPSHGNEGQVICNHRHPRAGDAP
jgi:hypothetical protein